MRWSNFNFLLLVILMIFNCSGGEGPPIGIIHVDTIYVDISSRIDLDHIGEISFFVTEELYGRSVDLKVIDPDDPADSLIIDPNGSLGDDNGYLGNGDEYLPADEATLHGSREDAYYGDFPIDNIKLSGDIMRIWIRVYPDYEGTYHPGDNFAIEAKLNEDTIVQTPTFYSWKRMRIEYDYFTGCELPDTSWWVISRIYSGQDLSYWGNYDANRDPYVEFKNDGEHLLKDDEITEDIYMTPPVYNYPVWCEIARNVIREKYRDHWDTGRWPFYLVAADSIDTTGTEFALPGGVTYMPSRDPNGPYPDSTNMFAMVYVKFLEWAESHGYVGYTGFVAAHELGHYIAYLNDFLNKPEEHSSSDCLMSYRGASEVLAEPRFCSECIYNIRGNSRRRGPLVLRGGN